MSIKIVLDSSADKAELDGVESAYAPLKVCTAERQFIDDGSINIREMVDYLYAYKGRSTSSCPNTEDWLTAFGEGEEILCITISSHISGSYNSARTAKEIYEEAHPDRRVAIIDSLTAGPEIALMAERVRELILAGETLDGVLNALKSYKTDILFVLESLKNFANNGRVSKAVAATAGFLGIRAIGRAGDQGTLEVLSKARGESKAMDTVMAYLKQYGYRGGRIRIDHCFAEEVVLRLVSRLQAVYPWANITVGTTGGLCSFYVEKGGYLVSFEA